MEHPLEALVLLCDEPLLRTNALERIEEMKRSVTFYQSSFCVVCIIESITVKKSVVRFAP